MVHALVPLKDLVAAKTRLAGLLRPQERRALAQAMVEDVLTTLSGHPLIESVTLVSDDPGADLLACKYQITAMDERSLDCRGLNAVIGAACGKLIAAGAEQLVVLHGDIPLLSGEDLTAVIDALAQGNDVVLGADGRGQGTNLIAFKAPRIPEFLFGHDSLALHCDSARTNGNRYAVLRRPGLALDVDEPADLALLLTTLKHSTAGHTWQLLQCSGLGQRIDALLESIDQVDTFNDQDGTTPL